MSDDMLGLASPATPDEVPGPGTPPLKKPRTESPVNDEVDLDDMISQLRAVEHKLPTEQNVSFPVGRITSLCHLVRDVIKEQDMLLDLEAPINLCGDIHGQYHDLLRIFNHAGYPPSGNYLFLGDYVDRGKRSLETICMLFAYKVKYPENFFLLRGNHESPSICRIYGFYDEVKQRYNVKLWKTFCDVFNYLPACAIVDERVICMHGGLSQHMFDNGDVRTQIRNFARPADIPDVGFLCDLLWSDPHPDISGFQPNDRGVSVGFGADMVARFLKQEDLDLIVRAHQVVEDGYEFFADRKLVTIFSAPNYCGEFDNAAAILNIDHELQCSFQVLKPANGNGGEP
mmetsp:Transcript_21684/g.47215  ORF Transcript_21684/g.47215 Transcript_21684/m.47215 type:complete len:343 (+) Transcript_21684:118-1146(+)